MESYYAQNLQFILDFLSALIQENAQTLADVFHNQEAFDQDFFTDEKMDQLLQESFKHERAMDILAESVFLDTLFETNFEDRAAERLREELKQVDLDEVLKNPVDSTIWEEVTKNKFKELPWTEELSQLNSLNSITDLDPNLLRDIRSEVMEDLIDKSSNFEELSEIVGEYRTMQIQLPTSRVISQAKALGLSKSEIRILLDDIVEYIKVEAESSEVSYLDMKNMINKRELSREQLYELANISKQYEQPGILAYVLECDLSIAKEFKDSPELLQEALSAGAGENFLEQWFIHSTSIREPIRSLIKQRAKEVMIELAKIKASALIGSSEAGGIPEGTIRPYVLGDELDAIDLEETIENIIMSGKQINDIDLEDFVVRTDVNGKRCVIFLIDVSGSMDGRPLAVASLTAAILLTAFNRDELGVALFESSTHVICEIQQNIDLETVVDEILELKAMGGTMLSRAVEWGRNQLELSSSEDKMFIMLTDAMVYDLEDAKGDLLAIHEVGATSVILLPEFGYSRSSVSDLIESINAQAIEIRDWKQFPQIVSKLLSRT